MNALASAIHRDLHEACSHLLDPVLAPGSALQAGEMPIGPLGRSLQLARTQSSVYAHALEELEYVPSALVEDLQPSPIPRRCVPSLRPSDYETHEERLVPTRWWTRESVVEPDPALLAWMLHGLEDLASRVERHRRELDEHLEEAIAFREGSSVYAREDVTTLRAFADRLGGIRTGIERWRLRIEALGDWKVRSSPKRPRPYPRSQGWAALRRWMLQLEDPSRMLFEVTSSLHGEPGLVDLPYLYQRWCGWKLANALHAMGWTCTEDPVPVLLLSGRLDFRKGHASLSILVDPRISRGKSNLDGLRSTDELTPDLVLITPGQHGRDAFVLDPTLAVQDAAARKAKYLDRITFEERYRIAGVLVEHRPLRAWAAAPHSSGKCVLGDWRGQTGVVPMNPVEYEDTPLQEWLGDILTHAERWSGT